MKIILTGGTIDSFYDTNSCTAVPFKNSVIKDYLCNTVAMDTHGIEFSQICMKDSRAITDDDRKEMCRQIESSDETKFVITHGTYTLFETARYIESHLKRKDVTVTVTGALIPLLGFAPTDAGFNIAAAMLNSQLNERGIYVFIKGKAYRASESVVLHA